MAFPSRGYLHGTPITAAQGRRRDHGDDKGRAGNPYRGWTLVERPDGLAMTRDNLRYVRVPGGTLGQGGQRTTTLDEFHRMVDGMEDR